MGMFDTFWFEEGVLPDNKENSKMNFQTKDLDQRLDLYFVDKDLNVKKLDMDGTEDMDPLFITCEVYSYNFEGETKIQTYKIHITDNKLVHAKKLNESGYKL